MAMRRTFEKARQIVAGLVFAVTFGTVGVQTGCAFLAETIGMKPERPKLQLTRIEVKSVDERAINLLVSFAVTNPNSFDLDLDAMSYTIAVGGTELARGAHEGRFVVPAGKTAEVHLPVAVGTAGIIRVVRGILEAPEKAKAVVTAKARFKTPVGPIDLTIKEDQVFSRN